MRPNRMDDDAPRLLRHNPENDPDVPQLFLDLYLDARNTFCYRMMHTESLRSVWEAALRPKSSWVRRNPKQYSNRLHQLRAESWEVVCPRKSQLGQYAKADPTLMSVDPYLAYRSYRTKEEVIRANLRHWVVKGLKSFWNDRFSGTTYALFCVKSSSVALEGILPAPLRRMYRNAPNGHSRSQ